MAHDRPGRESPNCYKIPRPPPSKRIQREWMSLDGSRVAERSKILPFVYDPSLCISRHYIMTSSEVLSLCCDSTEEDLVHCPDMCWGGGEVENTWDWDGTLQTGKVCLGDRSIILHTNYELLTTSTHSPTIIIISRGKWIRTCTLRSIF